ncbi:MAG: rhodanese-like domain-containing protein, partial [Dehalococcoidia bacterium]
MIRKLQMLFPPLVTVMLLSASCAGNGTLTPTPTIPIINPVEIPRISAEELKAKLDAGSNIVIVDSRSAAAYEQSHIVGAISIPAEETAQR